VDSARSTAAASASTTVPIARVRSEGSRASRSVPASRSPPTIGPARQRGAFAPASASSRRAIAGWSASAAPREFARSA